MTSTSATPLVFLRDRAVLFMTGQSAGYLARPIPCELDHEILEVIERFRAASEDQRLAAREYVDRRPLWSVLLTFAERMACLAVREPSAERVESGLIALALGFSARCP